MDIWLSFLTGAAGAAVCSGIFSVVQMLIRRLWEMSDKGSAQIKALRYLMLYTMMYGLLTLILLVGKSIYFDKLIEWNYYSKW